MGEWYGTRGKRYVCWTFGALTVAAVGATATLYLGDGLIGAVARVVTCDSVPHASNDCAVDGLIAGGVAELAR